MNFHGFQFKRLRIYLQGYFMTIIPALAILKAGELAHWHS
jgi:hypothetical protein